ncbi:hypothetical protein [Sphingopyxis sp. GW247-27LB]|uniref:hypothetical protein n=1 Tax=Sphingopyxis sp. GW247-27LB TaxID=2012632 RepID=UPI000BA56F19|nr:hypothetical protein [Sphingopyxis sp. GW247-27LB]PAL20312.1 hypothetical protein CD928_18120 [Sphingopyxis sp. GW247-27LB]
MTEAGRVRRRRRPILLAGLLMSAVWAAWWLWPREPSIDFAFEMHPTAQMIFYDLVAAKPMELPVYKDRRFRSTSGAQIAARDVIRYDPGVANKISPAHTAMFRMAPGATRGDFTRAVRDIWSVCDADVAVAAQGQEETFLILGAGRGPDCAKTLRTHEESKGRRTDKI